jgi:quercetin 2,3-dioxygenase
MHQVTEATTMQATQPARRTVSRIDKKLHLGPDSQVDDRVVYIAPTEPVRTDPFLLLSEDWFSTPGFEWHPHRGLETVTLVLDGVLEHGDNLGNAGALTAGDVQWMTAGHGIIHRELAFRNERAHILQLWVNLPTDRKLVANRYQDLRAADRPVIERDGARLEVISGDVDGTSGPALNHWPISGTLITLEPDRRIDHLLAGADRAFFSVLSGEVTIAGKGARAGDTAWSDPVPDATVSVIELATARADTPSVVVAYSGQPIGEPVVMGGPFVMNTPAEITKAFEDFRSGKFGEVPKQARLQYL